MSASDGCCPAYARACGGLAFLLAAGGFVLAVFAAQERVGVTALFVGGDGLELGHALAAAVLINGDERRDRRWPRGAWPAVWVFSTHTLTPTSIEV